MSNVPREWTDEGQRAAAAARWPVLARLPDASPDTLGRRAAKPGVPGGAEYRFDPPQSGSSSALPLASAGPATTSQPHMLERGRPLGQRRIPRRDSSVLPRTNPFSNPRPRLIDSVAPAVRFITMVALFTAAGVWVQMLGRHTTAQPRSIEPPTTAGQSAAAPAKNVDDHTTPAPTATGPIETQPEPGARVGRTEGDDFSARDNSATGPAPAARPAVSPPHFLISAGSNVPRVRVSDENSATVGNPALSTSSTSNTSNGESANEVPAVARIPGFLIDVPNR